MPTEESEPYQPLTPDCGRFRNDSFYPMQKGRRADHREVYSASRLVKGRHSPIEPIPREDATQYQDTTTCRVLTNVLRACPLLGEVQNRASQPRHLVMEIFYTHPSVGVEDAPVYQIEGLDLKTGKYIPVSATRPSIWSACSAASLVGRNLSF
jgi:hypothetical protein